LTSATVKISDTVKFLTSGLPQGVAVSLIALSAELVYCNCARATPGKPKMPNIASKSMAMWRSGASSASLALLPAAVRVHGIRFPDMAPV
jgi:hypothetical protein